YAAVSTSVTNSISKSFFEKYLILEKERYAFLEKENLLDLYLESRFQNYFIGWYLKHVPRLKAGESQEALDTLFKIYQLYSDKIEEKKPIMVKFETHMKNGQYDEFINYCNIHFSVERVKDSKATVS